MNPTEAIPVLATSKPAPPPPPCDPAGGAISSRFSLASLALSCPKWYLVSRKSSLASLESSNLEQEDVRRGLEFKGREQRQKSALKEKRRGERTLFFWVRPISSSTSLIR